MAHVTLRVPGPNAAAEELQRKRADAACGVRIRGRSLVAGKEGLVRVKAISSEIPLSHELLAVEGSSCRSRPAAVPVLLSQKTLPLHPQTQRQLLPASDDC